MNRNRPYFQRALLALAILMDPGLRVGAMEVRNIPAMGVHQTILRVEKNVHPENQMVVYTKIDAKGRFLTDPADQNRPMFDFYWLMDGQNYKAVNGLIKSEIRKRFDPQWSGQNRLDHFTVKMNDLKEVNCDIPDPRLEVYATATDGEQGVEAQMNLGPSDGNMRIRLSSIATEGRAFPPAVYSVTLKGEEIVNGVPSGKKVVRKYRAKE